MIVATETGILHRMQQENPDKTFIAGQPSRGLPLHEDDHAARAERRPERHAPEVKVPPEIAERARIPIDRMVAIG